MHVRDLLGRKQSTMITVDASEPVQDAIRLMIDHNVGVATVASFELKRIDMDYFSEE